MKNGWFALVFVIGLIPDIRATAGDGEADGPPPPHFLQRMRPVGGWHPDSGGLFHWWDPCCFPKWCGPDDYCRKPMPRNCWSAYPPFYTLGPTAIPHP